MNRSIRAIAVATMITFIASSGCAWTFHPERRGNDGGRIAAGPFVGDLLWLIPGLLPGLVFLIVDFSSGAIYYGDHGRRYGQAIPHTAPSAASASAQSTVLVPN